MIKIVNDNVPKLLAIEGKSANTRPATDNKEFFSLLKEKMREDLDKLDKADTFKRKKEISTDLYMASLEFMKVISVAEGVDIEELYDERIERVGGFKDRLVLESVGTGAQEMVKYVLDYGYKNDYPELILGRNKEGAVYLRFMGGKEAYEKHVNTSDLERLMQIYEAAKKDDKEKKTQQGG